MTAVWTFRVRIVGHNTRSDWARLTSFVLRARKGVILKPGGICRAEESALVFNVGNEKQILRFAQNDKRRAQDDSVKRFFNKLLKEVLVQKIVEQPVQLGVVLARFQPLGNLEVDRDLGPLLRALPPNAKSVLAPVLIQPAFRQFER